MSEVLALPACLTTELLTVWVGFADVVRVDEAFSQAILRNEFLSMACSASNIYANPDPGVAMMTWAVRRCVSIRKILITEEVLLNDDERSNYLRKCGHAVSSVPMNFRDVVWRYPWLNYIDMIVADLCEFCPNVVDMDCGRFFSSPLYTKICESWPSLTSIHLSQETDCKALEMIARHCKQLCNIHISMDCHHLGDKKWENFLAQVGSRLLKVSGPFYHSGSETVAKYCPNLREFHGIIPTRWESEFTPEVILNGCPSLQNVHLGSWRYPVNYNRLNQLNERAGPQATILEIYIDKSLNDTQLLCSILQKCCNLTQLHVESDGPLNHTDIFRILGSYCPALTSLQLLGFCCMGVQNMTYLTAGCRKLQQFMARFTNICDEGLIMLMRSCPNLTRLHLSECKRITEASLLQISTLCPHLRDLKLEDLPYKQISKESYDTIMQSCRVKQAVCW